MKDSSIVEEDRTMSGPPTAAVTEVEDGHATTNTSTNDLELGLKSFQKDSKENQNNSNLTNGEQQLQQRRRRARERHPSFVLSSSTCCPGEELASSDLFSPSSTDSNNVGRNSENGSKLSMASNKTSAQSKWLLTTLIVLLGAAACAAFISFGFHATSNDMEGRFESSAQGITYHLLSSFTTYEMFALWIHESCHKSVQRNYNIDPYENVAGHLGYCTRSEFRRLYEYIHSQGVEFLSAQLLRNITDDVREAFELESKAYYETHHPQVNYTGLTQQVFQPDGGFYLKKREIAPYYMPIHYVEPVAGNEITIDLDKLASGSANFVLEALIDYKPVLSARLRLVQEKEDAYGVILAHPGVKTSIENVTRSNSIGQIVLRVPSFLEYALRSTAEDETVYLYDSTSTSKKPEESPSFLGALQVQIVGSSNTIKGMGKPVFTMLPEVELVDIPRPRNSRYYEQELDVAGRKWTLVVVSSAHQVDLLFVILGGAIIFAASLFCAAWFHSHLGRIAKINRMKSEAATERAELARIQATRERELNEFIAHEVRNPLSSAISALSFVSSGVTEHVPDPTNKKSIMEDVSIMDASLQFINELLRNMLDIHRARSRQITLHLSEMDIRRDILDPVAAILFMRGAKVDIEIDCPPDLAVKGDRMRMKQIILNLSANATKFVTKGYIRLRATVVDESVELSVEDSGPGIPLEKRHRLFAKFQESFDSLNQGTGIGLCVCQNLCELMGANIWLDETFSSDVAGCPGTRFVLRLNQPPLEIEKDRRPSLGNEVSSASPEGTTPERTDDDSLPDSLSVLIVDDDMMIRKMFRRAVLRVAPGWKIEEACNGETALLITETRKFHVIFIDQYMASVEKQLLGTETARALRARGIQSILCGLSANDMEQQFLESGADTFMMKPFPCNKDAMTEAFRQILKTRDLDAIALDMQDNNEMKVK